eukprot:502258_1
MCDYYFEVIGDRSDQPRIMFDVDPDVVYCLVMMWLYGVQMIRNMLLVIEAFVLVIAAAISFCGSVTNMIVKNSRLLVLWLYLLQMLLIKSKTYIFENIFSFVHFN